MSWLDEHFTPDEEVGTVEFNGWAGLYHDVPADGWYMIQHQDNQGFKNFELIEGQMAAMSRWSELSAKLEVSWDEPDEDDWVIQDLPMRGYQVSPTGDIFNELTKAYQFVKNRAMRDQVWPDVWLMDDHGGFRNITKEVFGVQDD